MKRIPKIFKDIMRCPDCCDSGVEELESGMICSVCGSLFAEEKGIVDLRPHKGLPRLSVYNDPDYLRLMKEYVSLQEFLYTDNGLLSWVQEAGHRQAPTWRSGRQYERILDVGCGCGAEYPRVGDCERYIGIDYDLSSLIQFKKKYPEACVVRGDAYSLPFESASFDYLMTVYNLEHLMYLDCALEEIGRVMRDDGELFISVPAEGGWAFSMGRRFSTARKWAPEGLDYLRAVEIDHVNCIWQLDRAIKRHFRIKRRACFPFSVPIFHMNLIISYQCVKRPCS